LLLLSITKLNVFDQHTTEMLTFVCVRKCNWTTEFYCRPFGTTRRPFCSTLSVAPTKCVCTSLVLGKRTIQSLRSCKTIWIRRVEGTETVLKYKCWSWKIDYAKIDSDRKRFAQLGNAQNWMPRFIITQKVASLVLTSAR